MSLILIFFVKVRLIFESVTQHLEQTIIDLQPHVSSNIVNFFIFIGSVLEDRDYKVKPPMTSRISSVAKTTNR